MLPPTAPVRDNTCVAVVPLPSSSEERHHDASMEGETASQTLAASQSEHRGPTTASGEPRNKAPRTMPSYDHSRVSGMFAAGRFTSDWPSAVPTDTDPQDPSNRTPSDASLAFGKVKKFRYALPVPKTIVGYQAATQWDLIERGSGLTNRTVRKTPTSSTPTSFVPTGSFFL